MSFGGERNFCFGIGKDAKRCQNKLKSGIWTRNQCIQCGAVIRHRCCTGDKNGNAKLGSGKKLFIALQFSTGQVKCCLSSD